MRVLSTLLILFLALSPALADWDISSTKERWNMVGEFVPIDIETTTEQHQITTHDGKRVILHFEAPEAVDHIVRLPGPRHPWPHAGCLMCLHNHLVGYNNYSWEIHNQSSDYLKRNGWGVWSTIHDNLHNDSTFKGEKGRGRYIYSVSAPKKPSVFVPTPLDICERMLETAEIKKDDVVYDLGCGDGRILIMAALKYNCRTVGLDIDPKCVKQTQENIERYGVSHLVRVYESDARKASLSYASVVTLYLMPNLSSQLRPRLQNLSTGTRIVAHDKPIPQWQPNKSFKVESEADGHEHAIYLWKVAAQQKDKPKCKT